MIEDPFDQQPYIGIDHGAITSSNSYTYTIYFTANSNSTTQSRTKIEQQERYQDPFE